MRIMLRLVVLLVVVLPLAPAWAQVGLAEGFKKLPEGAKVVLMPLDVELFSISAGGVMEPQAEWTSNANRHLRAAYQDKKDFLKVEIADLEESSDEATEELNRLHGAVGGAINLHHLGMLKLPTKDGKFDWSLGEGVQAVQKRTGADYALFTFIRDSYASSERAVAMVVGALFGVGLPGGFQAGYASLVDLRTGQVVWFNRLLRSSGDLRELGKAKETLDSLLEKFPS